MPRDEQHLDDVCYRFEQDWSARLQSDFRPWLAEASESEQTEYFQELLLTDLEIRQRHRLPCSKEEYLLQYPEHADFIRSCFQKQSQAETAFDSPAHAGESAGSSSEELLGAQVGAYRLLEVIGKGGMGVVYKAQSTELDRQVALKMIRTGALATEMEKQRFLLEAGIASNFEHPSIVPVYHVGFHQDQPYFCMKLIAGSDLRDHLETIPADQRESRAWQQQTAKLLLKVASAVHHAHQRGVIHRDLKPGNVMLNQQGEPFVTDFGLAKHTEKQSALTETGQVAMTPEYASPEQARGEVGLTFRTDVYSLGVILYEMLTGTVPIEGDNTLDTIVRIQTELPRPPRDVNPQLDRRLEAICLKCLEKNPEDRYGSAEELAVDLESFVYNRRVEAASVHLLDVFHDVLSHTHEALHSFRAMWRTFVFIGILAAVWGPFMCWILITGQPEICIWPSLLAPYLVYIGLSQWHQNRGLPARTNLIGWVGTVLSMIALLIAARQWIHGPFAHLVLQTYPGLIILHGLTLFIFGSIYWGRHYAFGMAYLILATLSPLKPEWAPLGHGMLTTIIPLLLAVHLRHMDREEKSTERELPSTPVAQ